MIERIKIFNRLYYGFSIEKYILAVSKYNDEDILTINGMYFSIINSKGIWVWYNYRNGRTY